MSTVRFLSFEEFKNVDTIPEYKKLTGDRTIDYWNEMVADECHPKNQQEWYKAYKHYYNKTHTKLGRILTQGDDNE